MHENSEHFLEALTSLSDTIKSLGNMPWVFWSTLLNLGLLIVLWKTFLRAHYAEQRADAESAEVRRLCDRGF